MERRHGLQSSDRKESIGTQVKPGRYREREIKDQLGFRIDDQRGAGRGPCSWPLDRVCVFYDHVPKYTRSSLRARLASGFLGPCRLSEQRLVVTPFTQARNDHPPKPSIQKDVGMQIGSTSSNPARTLRRIIFAQ